MKKEYIEYIEVYSDNFTSILLKFDLINITNHLI